MLKNYLLLSLKVLRRKPFYAFVSLFGISFTLMILMLLVSLFDAALGANRPMSNRDNLVVAPTVRRLRIEMDTVWKYDTLNPGTSQMKIDSSFTVEERQTSDSNGPMGYKFLMNNLMDMESVERVAIFNTGEHVDGFLDGRKVSLNTYYVNASYWEVLDFRFLHGGPFLSDDEESATKVAILTDKSARDYFGVSDETVIGKEIELENQRFRVKGIVERPYSDSPMFAGDVFLPATTIDRRVLDSDEFGGGFMMIAEVSDPSRRRLAIEELQYIADNLQLPPDSYFNKVKLTGAGIVDAYAMGILQDDDADAARRKFFLPILVLIALFVALPLINLVNLNISRVYERQSEIGVRKAFGADSGDILVQFVFENLVVTIVGGVVGILLARGIIGYVNTNDLLGVTRLAFSYKTFVYFILTILLFGLISGLMPAYRMSQTNVAEALR